VSVVPEVPVQGAWTVLTVRVPTESPTASTVRVEVTFPVETPVPAVRTTHEPGWESHVTVEDLAEPVEDAAHGRTFTQTVTSVVWEATDPATAVAPGEFRDFSVQAGPLPAVPELVLPTVQTYDDGTQVRWIERTVDGGRPEHPAPVVALDPAAEAAVVAAGAAHHGTPAAAGEVGTRDGSGWLPLLALVAALLALVTAAASWRRRPAPSPPAQAGSDAPDPPDAVVTLLPFVER